LQGNKTTKIKKRPHVWIHFHDALTRYEREKYRDGTAEITVYRAFTGCSMRGAGGSGNPGGWGIGEAFYTHRKRQRA